MKIIKFISLFALVILFYSSKLFSEEQKSGTKFIVAGHLYPITKDQIKLNKFAEKVNSHNPDYVFLLGDSDLQDRSIYDYLNTVKVE